MGRLGANLGWPASRQKEGTLMSSKSANLRLARMSSAGHAHLESYAGLSPERGRKSAAALLGPWPRWEVTHYDLSVNGAQIMFAATSRSMGFSGSAAGYIFVPLYNLKRHTISPPEGRSP